MNFLNAHYRFEHSCFYNKDVKRLIDDIGNKMDEARQDGKFQIDYYAKTREDGYLLGTYVYYYMKSLGYHCEIIKTTGKDDPAAYTFEWGTQAMAELMISGKLKDFPGMGRTMVI